MGQFGNFADLPYNDYEHAGGNITSAFFEAPEDGTIYRMGMKIRSSSDTNNEARMGVYDLVSNYNADNLVLSPDVKTFSTSLVTLEFDLSKQIFATDKYVFALQGKSNYYFVYDNIAEPGYLFFGGFTFGSFPSSQSGLAEFNNTLQVWADYSTPSGVKKRLMLMGVGR